MVAVGLSVIVVTTSCSSDGSSVLDVNSLPDDERCLDVGEEVGALVTDLNWVPCESPDPADDHTHEVYGVADYFVVSEDNPATTIKPGDYPGREALELFAQAECFAAFERYVGISPLESALFYSWLIPTLTSWENDGDREVLCVAGNANGDALTQSIRGSQR